jgi:hypothetical protein
MPSIKPGSTDVQKEKIEHPGLLLLNLLKFSELLGFIWFGFPILKQ